MIQITPSTPGRALFVLLAYISLTGGQSSSAFQRNSFTKDTTSQPPTALCFDLVNALEGRTLKLRDNNISLVDPGTGRYPGMNVTYLSKYVPHPTTDRKIIEYDTGPVNVKLTTNEEFRSVTISYISAKKGKAEMWRGNNLVSSQDLIQTNPKPGKFMTATIKSSAGEISQK